MSQKQKLRLKKSIEATFTDTCTVRNRSFTPDGKGGRTVTNKDIPAIPCRRLVDQKPKESETAGAVQGSTQYAILLPLETTINRQSQILMGDSLYEVANILDHTDNFCLRIICTRAD